MTRPKNEADKVYRAVTPADVIPFLGQHARIEDGVVVTKADTAWRLNDYLRMRRYRTSEKRKAYDAVRHREWVERNREHVRQYNREWKRRRRAA